MIAEREIRWQRELEGATATPRPLGDESVATLRLDVKAPRAGRLAVAGRAHLKPAAIGPLRAHAPAR